jgi:hypothetical protein
MFDLGSITLDNGKRLVFHVREIEADYVVEGMILDTAKVPRLTTEE